MDTAEWWAKLTQATRAWLIANNGDAVPQQIVDEITAAGGGNALDDSSARSPNGGSDVLGFHLSDSTTDWIEEVANGEGPGE
ncbi:MAG: hypothetical protein JWR01_1970 [Subtercola sp.]|nr:hypothetical protein [Subtercola sp.]